MGFERLEVWKKAVSFCQVIYSVTRTFPRCENYGLISQVRRAAVSIPANIAEGAGRNSNPDFCRFISIAFGSINEVITLLIIAQECEYLSLSQKDNILEELRVLQIMLSKLSAKLKD